MTKAELQTNPYSTALAELGMEILQCKKLEQKIDKEIEEIDKRNNKLTERIKPNE